MTSDEWGLCVPDLEFATSSKQKSQTSICIIFTLRSSLVIRHLALLPSGWRR